MRILLADHRTLFLEGLQNLLHGSGIEVVGRALNSPEILDQTRLLEPDVVLMSAANLDRDRLELVRRLKTETPAVKIIVLADNDADLPAAVQNGASGYLLTSIEGEELLQNLRNLERGEAPFPSDLSAKALNGIARWAAEREQVGSRGGRRRAGPKGANRQQSSEKE